LTGLPLYHAVLNISSGPYAVASLYNEFYVKFCEGL